MDFALQCVTLFLCTLLHFYFTLNKFYSYENFFTRRTNLKFGNNPIYNILNSACMTAASSAPEVFVSLLLSPLGILWDLDRSQVRDCFPLFLIFLHKKRGRVCRSFKLT